MPKFSIIIPIYKVERYLEACVESVLTQTCRDIEVVLVDDGSPDGCPAMADAYAERDSRVLVLHKPNGGLSSARNAGLRHATGDYVVFLDSDDYYLDRAFLEKVAAVVDERQPDAVFFQRTQVEEGREHILHRPTLYPTSLLLEGDTEALLLALARLDKLDAHAALKATRREVLLGGELFFREGLLSEDVEWFCRYMQMVHSVALVNTPAYCYRKRAGSITHTKTAKNIHDHFLTLRLHARAWRDSRLAEARRRAVLSYLSYQWYISLGLARLYLEGEELSAFMREARTYQFLTAFSLSPKTRRCAKVVKICNGGGVRLTLIRVLHSA